MSYYYYEQFNKLELHYWVMHDLHTMDANVQNKCEQDFLNLLSDIAAKFDVEIQIDTEAIAEGGLRRYYKIFSKKYDKKGNIRVAVISAIAISVFTTPITTPISKICEVAIDKIFNSDTIELQDEKMRLEIEKLRQEIKIDSLRLNKSLSIENNRNNFYQLLEEDDRIEKVSFVLKDEKQKVLIAEKVVDKSDFKNHQEYSQPLKLSAHTIKNDELFLIEEIHNASIELIAPDFSINSDKWKGLYNDKLITFKIVSEEFNNLVQAGNLEFKKGAVIKCDLVIRRKNRSTKIYEVVKVNSFK